MFFHPTLFTTAVHLTHDAGGEAHHVLLLHVEFLLAAELKGGSRHISPQHEGTVVALTAPNAYSKLLCVSLWLRSKEGSSSKEEELVTTATTGPKAYDSVITIGGLQSNHVRCTAVIARQMGYTPHVILRGEEGELGYDETAPQSLVGNLLLDRMVGAVVYPVTVQAYRAAPNGHVTSLSPCRFCFLAHLLIITIITLRARFYSLLLILHVCSCHLFSP